MEKIKIKYLADIEPLEQHGDWIDLRAAEDAELKKWEYKLIPLGVAMELPKGCEAHIYPILDEFEKHKIIPVNSMWIIVDDFCSCLGEWYFPSFTIEDTFIKKNDKICQFRIMKKQPEIAFDVVDSLGNDDRGRLGSTGRI